MRTRSSAENSWSSAPCRMHFDNSSDTCPRVSLIALRWITGFPPLALSFCSRLERVVLISTSRGMPSSRT